MAIYFGNNNIKEIYVGSIKIKEVYYGNKKVWSGVRGYWIHKDTGVKTEFGLDDPSIVNGIMRKPSWATNASEVQIPLGVKELGNYCFQYCSSLTSITLPESLTSIGNNCFQNCISLTSVNIPEGVTSLGDNCFSNCASFTSISIPESITSIGGGCFYYCPSLTLATVFPETPPSLGWLSFDEVHSSFEIKVPSDSVNDYKTAPIWIDYADIISGIDSYLIDKDNNVYHFDLSNTPITNFERESAITVNGNQMINRYINEIHFGDSYANVTTIGDYFVGNCENLVTLDISKLTNITSIGNSFLYNCKSLAAIDLTILSNITSVGDNFLGLCTSITSIDLSPLSNVTTIGGSFLSLCYSLPSIDFTPLSNVTTIGINFLMSCDELTTVDLSSLTNLNSIGTYFLADCAKLTTLIMGAITAPTLGSSSLNRTNQLSSIIVPCGSVDSYKNKWYSTQKIDLISDICEPEPIPWDGLFVLGSIYGVLGDGVEYTDELKHLNYFTENIDEITSGGGSSAIISNGKLYTWGSNSFGQLGHGNHISSIEVPRQVGVDADWTKVSMGANHTLAIKNGSLYAWGDNYNRQLAAVGDKASYPIKISNNNDWVEVYAFEDTSIGKRSNGLWYGWGNSRSGEIGYPDPPNDFNTFVSITQLPHSTILSGASKITFGKQHGLVINNGSLYGFGNGANYVFGNENTRQYSYPVKLNNLTWTDIACGYEFSFGISNGELYFWGNPSSSVSGYGATQTVTSPQKVDNNSDWTNIYVTKGQNYRATVIGIRNGDAYIWGAFYEYRENTNSWATIYINTPRLLETDTNIINVVGMQQRMLILKQS